MARAKRHVGAVAGPPGRARVGRQPSGTRARDEDRLREAAISAKSSAKSEGLVGALKRRKFRAMFAALDADADGAVDLRAADLSRLADVDAETVDLVREPPVDPAPDVGVLGLRRGSTSPSEGVPKDSARDT